MAGLPVSIGCAVVVSPGAGGPPDSGTIIAVLPPYVTANGLPLAKSGSLCLMVNSLTGVPYTIPIGPIASAGVSIGGQPLVRIGDNIPSPPGIMTVLGPPAAPFIIDQWSP